MSEQTPEVEFSGSPTALYRLYDKDGCLLYIGVSQDLTVRMYQHAQLKPWWPEVTRKTMVLHGSRAEAEAAERAALRAEQPLHNINGTGRRAPTKRRVARQATPAPTTPAGGTITLGSGVTPAMVERLDLFDVFSDRSYPEQQRIDAFLAYQRLGDAP